MISAAVLTDELSRPTDVFTSARDRVQRFVAAGATLEQLDELIRTMPGMDESARRALWIEAWRYAPLV